MTDYKKKVETARWKVLDLLPRGSLELDKAIVEYGYACAAQARATALEEAAVEMENENTQSGESVSAAIRALKETP